jgi:hypothetical protein
MKQITFLILFSLIYFKSFSQDLKYKGPMNKSIFSEMTPFEKMLYVDCLEHINIIEDTIIWVSPEKYNIIRKKKSFSYILEVETNNKTEITKSNRYLGKMWGKSVFPNPTCFLSISRKNDFSQIKVYCVR